MFDKAIPRSEPLTIVWINDNYNRYKHFMQSHLQRCSWDKNISKNFTCHKLFISKEDEDHREYYLMGTLYFDGKYFVKKQMTWEDANKMCRLIDGHLPWFGSRDRLNELMAFLKLSQYFPTLEAIYIGLRFHENDVSKYLYSYLLYHNTICSIV